MKRIAVVFATLLSMGTLHAQQGPPPHGPHFGAPPLDALKSYLSLSDKQVQDSTALLTSFRDGVKPIHEQIVTKEKELKQEMDKASPDSSLAAQLMVDIKALRNQVKAKRDDLKPQLMALLNDNQKNALLVLQQALSVEQAAHQAAGLGLIDAPANSLSGREWFGGGEGGMHSRPGGRP
jgi:hypothetical protein